MHDLYVKMQFYDSATNELVYIRKQIGAFIEILYSLCLNYSLLDLLEEDNKPSEPSSIHKAKDFYKSCVNTGKLHLLHCPNVCIPILVTTFPEWLSGTEPLPHTPGAVLPSSLCL